MQVQKEQIRALLQAHKVNLARKAYLEIQIAKLERGEYEEYMGKYQDLCKAQVLTGMPRSSKAGNPTERQGIYYAAKLFRSQIDREVEKLKAELEKVNSAIALIENALAGLKEKDRWAVWETLVERKSILTIQNEQEEHGEYVWSRSKIRRCKNQGLQDLQKILV